MTRVLNLPGYQGSSPAHWQSLWERLDARIERVEQADWEAPELAAWIARLAERVAQSPEPSVLVGHSLGALLAAHFATHTRAAQVVGALLVAPPDLELTPGLPACLSSFAPIPRARLPFPAIVMASRDDPYCSLERARGFAESWGASFVDVGAAGHVNADSALGTFRAGRTLLAELARRAPFAIDPRLAADARLIGESALSLLLLLDDARYPWFVLVPKRSAACELSDLDDADQRALYRELHVLADAVGRVFEADKVNVGALGNVVRQLHVHVLARRLGDPAWPGHSPRVAYGAEAAREVTARLFSDRAIASHFSVALWDQSSSRAPA
jgi:uncharacterized protein